MPSSSSPNGSGDLSVVFQARPSIHLHDMPSHMIVKTLRGLNLLLLASIIACTFVGWFSRFIVYLALTNGAGTTAINLGVEVDLLKYIKCDSELVRKAMLGIWGASATLQVVVILITLVVAFGWCGFGLVTAAVASVAELGKDPEQRRWTAMGNSISDGRRRVPRVSQKRRHGDGVHEADEEAQWPLRRGTEETLSEEDEDEKGQHGGMGGHEVYGREVRRASYGGSGVADWTGRGGDEGEEEKDGSGRSGQETMSRLGRTF
ncbi:hypothetical protein JCM11641_004141 [Rhodosporidiobolus odoratus]